jgi:raffinose/stachyose/melibiose transport system permease protein
MALRIMFHVLFAIIAVSILYPLVLSVGLSMKSMQEIFTAPLALPKAFHFENYSYVLGEAKFGIYLRNSVLISACSVVLLVFLASMASYILARKKFPGQRLINALFLAGLIIPLRLVFIPLFILMRQLKLVNTLTGLVLIYPAAHMAFAILLLTNFMKTVPREMEEAATLDGASDFGIYFRIVLPVTRPGLATVTIFSGVAIWNDFFLPLILITNDRFRTLPLGLSDFVGEYFTRWDLLFTGIIIAILPAVILYLVMSRQFISGLTAGALK